MTPPSNGTGSTQVEAATTFDRRALANLCARDQELFETFGRGPVVEPTHPLIHTAFESQAALHPSSIAIEHRGENISYGHLNNAANQLANRLAQQGVAHGDTVGIFLTRSIPMVVGILATLKLGAAYVPQHVGVAPEFQLRHIISVADLSAIITLTDLVDQIPVVAGVPVLQVEPTDYEDAPPTSNAKPHDKLSRTTDRCFILFTSGTTGPANGVQVTHANICNVLLTDPGRMGMAPGRKVSQLLNIAFDMAAWEILGALMNGATLLIRGSDLTETASAADIVIATPSVLGSIDFAQCSGVQTVAVAGEPCPRHLADTWSRTADFYNSCGPTETTIVNTIYKHDIKEAGLPIGAPTPNNTVYVLDSFMKPCRIGQVGEMWAGGACVTDGYLNNPELTAERYAPDPFLGGDQIMFRTRDLGRWNCDGNLEHHGRTDDQVKIRGFRVELDSVAAALETTPSCTAAVAIRVDSTTLSAFVQPFGVDPTEAAAAVARLLPYYCVPDSITPLAELPRTTRGKIDKTLLAKLADASHRNADAARQVA